MPKTPKDIGFRSEATGSTHLFDLASLVGRQVAAPGLVGEQRGGHDGLRQQHHHEQHRIHAQQRPAVPAHARQARGRRDAREQSHSAEGKDEPAEQYSALPCALQLL